MNDSANGYSMHVVGENILVRLRAECFRAQLLVEGNSGLLVAPTERGFHNVVLNLTGVEMPIGELISELAELRALLAKSNRTLHICGLARSTRDSIEALHLDSFFRLHDDERTALEQGSDQPP